MERWFPIAFISVILVVCFTVIVVVDDSEDDTCVRETAYEFARSLPGYFTPEQIVEQAETFCRVNKGLEERGRGREDAVNDLLNNR